MVILKKACSYPLQTIESNREKVNICEVVVTDL